MLILLEIILTDVDYTRILYFELFFLLTVFFSRTPGSRQPSPSDEDINKNMAVAAVTVGTNNNNLNSGNNSVVVVENLHAHHPLMNHPLTLPMPPHHPHPQHHQLNQLDSINHQFSDQMLDQNAFDAHQVAVNSQQMNHQAAGIDSSSVVSFEVRFLVVSLVHTSVD